jgi:hypothetical protein
MNRNRPALAFEATIEDVLPRFLLGSATPLRRFENMGGHGPHGMTAYRVRLVVIRSLLGQDFTSATISCDDGTMCQ